MHRAVTTRHRAILRMPLSPAAKVLLWEIVDHAWHDRGVCTATNAGLAAGVRLSKRHVGRLLASLAQAGWLVVERQADPLGSVRRRIRLGLSLSLDELMRQGLDGE